MAQEQGQVDQAPAGVAHEENAPTAPRLLRWLERWRPAAPVLLLFAIGVASVFGLTYLGGMGLDREAATASVDEMAGQAADRSRTLGSIARDYAWWDEAVQNLVTDFSPAWAKANLGRGAIGASYPQVTGVLALGGDGRILYGFLGDREFGAPAPLDLDPVGNLALARLADAARAEGIGGSVPVAAALRLEGTVYLASAAVVTPFSQRVPMPARAPVLVTMTALDSTTLAAMATATRVEELAVAGEVNPEGVGQALTGADGATIAYLTWIPPRPGKHLIDRLMLPILLVTLVLAVLCVIALDQILRARRAAESYAELVVAKNSSLQQAAGLLSLTVDSIDEGIVVMRENGEIRHWNKTYERMWHFGPGVLRVGAMLQDVIAWKLRHGGYEVVDDDDPAAPQLQEGRQPIRRRLYRDAHGRLIESRRFEMPDGQGQIGVTRDLTDAKKREQALIEAREQAVLASRAKSEFLANVSHELRTPLNAIIGFSEVLEVELYGAIENERYRSYIRDIRKSGLNLLDLINDILDFSKIEAGKLELRIELCDCSAIALDAARQVSHQLRQQGLDFAMDLPEQPVLIHADGRAVYRALLNLLSNAVKFTPTGGTVTMSYRRTATGMAPGVVFTVRDTGIGIAPEDIEKAMAPFGQIDSDMARRYRGTGLGLSIVKGISDLHGGSVDIVSEVGAGTSITLVIPDQRLRDAAPAEKASPREPARVG